MKKNFKFEKENFKKGESFKKGSKRKREKRRTHINMEEYDEKEL